MLDRHELLHPLNDAIAERATAFLAPAFCDAIGRTYGCKAFSLPVSHDGQLLPAYRIKRPWKKEVTLAPYNCQPVLRDRNEEIVRNLIAVASERGPSWSVKARLHHRLAQDIVDEFNLACTHEIVETLVSLEDNFESVVARMQPRQRTKWRKATVECENLAISQIAGEADLHRFYRILTRTYRDKHRMVPQPFRWFHRLISPTLSPTSVRTYAAHERATSRLLGGIIVITDAFQWCYAWGATDQGGGYRDLSTLLIGKAMQDALAAGARVFSLGASPISHESLRQFKRAWGGEEHPVLTYYWRQIPNEVDLHTGFPLAKSLVALSPLWVLRGVSPLAVKVLA